MAERLLSGLRRSSRVRIVETTNDTDSVVRLPVVSFLHESIPGTNIVQQCMEKGFICRYGKFLSTAILQSDYLFDTPDHCGVVRFSLTHYNTVSEVERLLDTLETIPEWF